MAEPLNIASFIAPGLSRGLNFEQRKIGFSR